MDPEPVSSTQVPAGTTAITFAITGTSAQVGKSFVYSVAGTGAAAVSNQLTEPATLNADGNAEARVTVAVTTSTVGSGSDQCKRDHDGHDGAAFSCRMRRSHRRRSLLSVVRS